MFLNGIDTAPMLSNGRSGAALWWRGWSGKGRSDYSVVAGSITFGFTFRDEGVVERGGVAAAVDASQLT
jgi:hypothetical protein